MKAKSCGGIGQFHMQHIITADNTRHTANRRQIGRFALKPAGFETDMTAPHMVLTAMIERDPPF
jgi:alanine racemase